MGNKLLHNINPFDKMNKTLLIAGIIALSIYGIVSHSQKVAEQDRAFLMLYKQWKEQQNKVQLPEEEDMYRYSVFKSNYYSVEKFNEESYASNDSDAVFLELNKFADLTLAEF